MTYVNAPQNQMRCPSCKRADRMVVTVRCGNYSAFNGYRFTPSRYSELRCLACGRYWRSKAAGVVLIRRATQEELTCLADSHTPA